MVATARWRRLARRWLVAIAVAGSVPSALGVNLGLPNKTDSLKFAVIGDFGTGDQPSYEVAAQMAALRARFPFEMVITTGDNIIGDQDDPSDLAEKFERPFSAASRRGRPVLRVAGPHQAGQIANRRGRVIGHCRRLNALELGGMPPPRRLGAIPSRASPAGQSAARWHGADRYLVCS